MELELLQDLSPGYLLPSKHEGGSRAGFALHFSNLPTFSSGHHLPSHRTASQKCPPSNVPVEAVVLSLRALA